MRAAGLDYASRSFALRDLPEPVAAPHELLLEVLEVGVCGTDRELAHFAFGEPPPGERFLILGHEALCRVANSAHGFTKGDYVVPQVRRTCPARCPSCLRHRRDLCVSGQARDRGITGVHGYLAPYAVDDPQDLVRIPAALADRAVLLEPLSVVEKAIHTALRLHEAEPRTALVMGAGPIGILAALALQVRGFDTTVASLEPPDDPRVRFVKKTGVRYEHGLHRAPKADLVFEATGSPAAALAGFALLAPLGVYAVIGASQPSGPIPLLDMVINNQVVFGTVNASPAAFAAAAEDLPRFDPAITAALIERRSFDDIAASVLGPPGRAVKVVHRVTE
ncbi:MAG: alcohol dehydrogenase catalytic domain-containing protein [Bryobacteraceae bacterium]|nr:alcohol dehydrogenase catalytic domain-containing protein [Bryobacteraceae bacterium]